MHKLNKFLPVLILVLSILSCSHKELKIDNGKYRENMLLVYNRLVNGIKEHDITSILSCYDTEAVFEYSEGLPGRFVLFNKELKTAGMENIRQQYLYLFRERQLDQIEFDIKRIDDNKLLITFINAWTYSDYRTAESIFFQVNSGKFNIIRHYIHRYE